MESEKERKETTITTAPAARCFVVVVFISCYFFLRYNVLLFFRFLFCFAAALPAAAAEASPTKKGLFGNCLNNELNQAKLDLFC